MLSEGQILTLLQQHTQWVITDVHKPDEKSYRARIEIDGRPASFQIVSTRSARNHAAVSDRLWGRALAAPRVMAWGELSPAFSWMVYQPLDTKDVDEQQKTQALLQALPQLHALDDPQCAFELYSPAATRPWPQQIQALISDPLDAESVRESWSKDSSITSLLDQALSLVGYIQPADNLIAAYFVLEDLSIGDSVYLNQWAYATWGDPLFDYAQLWLLAPDGASKRLVQQQISNQFTEFQQRLHCYQLLCLARMILLSGPARKKQLLDHGRWITHYQRPLWIADL